MAIGMTVDGMISGMSTTTIIDQLMSVEALGQTKLKTKVAEAEKAAAAYRSINTKMDALRTAAENMTKFGAWTPAAFASSAASVSAVTGLASQAGALTFSVIGTAATHSVVSATTWGATTDASGFGTSLEVLNKDGTSRGTVTIGGSGTLADTVDAINKSSLGLSAAAVQVSPGQYRLQVTSATSGEDASFSLGAPGDFAVTTQGSNAHVKVGTGPGAYDVYSASNDFVGLLPGTTIKVSKPETDVTVKVTSDPEKVASTMQALVDAANAALTEITKHTKTDSTTKSTLTGDFTMSQLASQIRDAVANAVGPDGSPGALGVELTREGGVKFDKEKFLKALADNPAKVQAVLSGTAAAPGADGLTGTGDDQAAVPGTAMRLLALSKQVSDKANGSLTLLAQGRDKLADDLQDRIEGWDVRLEKRRETLIRQFTAMEVALGSMKSQSSWLAGQISGLPTYS
jgi:flagellar hook-associated protein 2